MQDLPKGDIQIAIIKFLEQNPLFEISIEISGTDKTKNQWRISGIRAMRNDLLEPAEKKSETTLLQHKELERNEKSYLVLEELHLGMKKVA